MDTIGEEPGLLNQSFEHIRTYLPWPLPLPLPLLPSTFGCVVAAESSIWAISTPPPPSPSCAPSFPSTTEPAAVGAAASVVAIG